MLRIHPVAKTALCVLAFSLAGPAHAQTTPRKAVPFPEVHIDDGFWRGGLDGIGAIRRHCLERRGRGHARQAHFLVGFEQPGGRFRFNPDGTSIGPYGVTVSASSIGWTTTSGPAKSTR